MRPAALGLLLLLAAGPARARELQPATYLRKLSLHLRGTPPAPEEQAALLEAEGRHGEEAFLRAKVAEYLASPAYADKLSYLLEELFRLETAKAPARVETALAAPAAGPYYQNGNALNYLFHSLATDNLSWDQLLTGKSYRLFPDTKRQIDHNRTVEAPSDNAFLEPLLHGNRTGHARDVGFPATDPRVAGAITTARFFERYPTTSVNKNRKRAAAVFSIFLCDNMAPVIPAPSADEGGLLDQAFPDPHSITAADREAAGRLPDAHGARPDCKACHYKLDPVGRTFVTSPTTLNSIASPGELVYTNRSGKLVRVPVAGLGGLGAAIAAQPEFVSCQLRHFWDWYIGRDRPLTPKRERELAAKFAEVGHRTNDFVAYLVQSPEFRSVLDRTPAQARADRVKMVLGNCAGCHQPPIPDFTEWPIGGTRGSMQSWAGKIRRILDLEHDGLARKMPPKASPWQPTKDDFSLLRTWLDDRAPGEDGMAQL